jgi:hypothetical protein
MTGRQDDKGRSGWKAGHVDSLPRPCPFSPGPDSRHRKGELP